MERVGNDEEAIRSYDAALGIDPTDKIAWCGKGIVLIRLEKHDLAKRSFEKALEIDRNMESAMEGLRIVSGKLREREISAYAQKLVEYEYRSGKRLTREEAFRECGIPFSHLDDVLKLLDEKEAVNVISLSQSAFKEYEELSRAVLLASYRSPSVGRYGLRLPDVLMNLPEKDIRKAKKVLAYIERVNDMDFSTVTPDRDTEQLLRTAMSLPDEKRSAIGLMENLGVGIFNARKLMAILQTFRGEGYKASSVKVREIPWKEESVDIEKDERERKVTELKAVPPTQKHRGTRDEVDLYSRFYKEEEKAVDQQANLEEIKGRRCLFHGGLAVTKCHTCGSLLCSDCVSQSDSCPRCGSKIKRRATRTAEGQETGKEKSRAASEPGRQSRDLEGEEDKDTRDWTRL